MSPQRSLSLACILTLARPAVGICDPPAQSPAELAQQTATEVQRNVEQAVSETMKGLSNRAQEIEQSDDLIEVKTMALDVIDEMRADTGYYTTLSRKLAEQRGSLEEAAEKHERDVRELEAEKDLISMGFYTSVAAIAVGAVTVIMRWPLFRLDRQLRQLEVEKLQHELREIGSLQDGEEG